MPRVAGRFRVNVAGAPPLKSLEPSEAWAFLPNGIDQQEVDDKHVFPRAFTRLLRDFGGFVSLIDGFLSLIDGPYPVRCATRDRP